MKFHDERQKRGEMISGKISLCVFKFGFIIESIKRGCMDAKVYLSKIEEIVEAKFEGDGIDLEFPRETVEETRLQRSKIVRMQKELGRIRKAVNAEIDTLRSTYEERKARVRPEGLAWLSYPSAKKSKEQQMARILREEKSALDPLKKVRGVIDVIQFSLDQVKGTLDSEIEQGALLQEK